MASFQYAHLDTFYNHWVSWSIDFPQRKIYLAVTSDAGLQIAEVPHSGNYWHDVLNGLAELLEPFTVPELHLIFDGRAIEVDEDRWTLVEPVTVWAPPPIDDFSSGRRVTIEDAHRVRIVQLPWRSCRTPEGLATMIIQAFGITNPDVLYRAIMKPPS